MRYRRNNNNNNNNSSSYSLLCILPTDCSHHILSYLCLADVIQYGTTSIQSLVDIEPVLLTRVRTLLSSSSSNENKTHHDNSSSNVSFLHHLRAHVEYLTRVLPNSHRLQKDVTNLLQSIDTVSDRVHPAQDEGKTDSIDMLPSPAQKLHCHSSYPMEHKMNVKECLARQQDILKMHKAHSAVLRNAIQHDDDDDDDNEGDNIITVDGYVGDVLCVSCLMGKMDGGPNEINWMRNVMKGAMKKKKHHLNNNGTSERVQWHRVWVLLHSTLLRTVPFLSQDRAVLGISDGLDYYPSLHPTMKKHPLFPSLSVSTCKQLCKFMEEVLIHNNYENRHAHICFRFNDFGPLGPTSTFRGRDRIRTTRVNMDHTISLLFDKLVSQLKSWDKDSSDDDCRVGQQQTARMSEYQQFQYNIVLERLHWMFDVHGKAFKARPMTVKPPVVTFSTGDGGP